MNRRRDARPATPLIDRRQLTFGFDEPVARVRVTRRDGSSEIVAVDRLRDWLDRQGLTSEEQRRRDLADVMREERTPGSRRILP